MQDILHHKLIIIISTKINDKSIRNSYYTPVDCIINFIHTQIRKVSISQCLQYIQIN